MGAAVRAAAPLAAPPPPRAVNKVKKVAAGVVGKSAAPLPAAVVPEEQAPAAVV
eukprot:gene4519-7782_t